MTQSEFEHIAQELRSQMLSGRNVSGLAIKVAKNCCVNLYRKRQSAKQQHFEDISPRMLRQEDTTGSPQERLEAQDTQRMMDEVVALLKPRERQLFEMRQTEGLSTADIAEQTGIPKASVAVMLSTAQQLINKYLEGETSPEEERLLALALQGDDMPEEWQAIRLMLGELTIGEAEYDNIMEQRKEKQRKPSALLVAIRTISSMAAIYLVGLKQHTIKVSQRQQRPPTAQKVHPGKY